MSRDASMLAAMDANGTPLSDPIQHADRIDHYLDMSASPPERVEVGDHPDNARPAKATKRAAKAVAKKAPAKKAAKKVSSKAR